MNQTPQRRRYICIHGHFYQPPRENPWLQSIEVQDSAAPYHDWNERITAECYEPNAYARILDSEGYIDRIVSNYTRISWNFGPTLLSYLEDKAPRVYQALLQADRDSQARFSGHGSALAQGYNHAILPLCSRRDKVTQVVWGVRDFTARFGRQPEGMWLPETAVDLETLDILAEQGLRFTILAPSQARAVRRIGDPYFTDVQGSRVDPGQPYLVSLPSGRSIAVFFYDGPISRAVAFERLLTKGEYLAERLLQTFAGEPPSIPGQAPPPPRLCHIATDGETYGHHHPFGEMALAYALSYLEQHQSVELTNYGEFLEKFPPAYEAQILENTAWSCAHGVDRWQKDCGCSSGNQPGWNQRWRGPLRAAFDLLRDQLAPLYDHKASELLRDPWAARNAYIEVVLAQSSPLRLARQQLFIQQHARRALTSAETATVLKLLELQLAALLMYTSCGWFFDDVSGPEPMQNLAYAARVLQLAKAVFGAQVQTLETQFLALLQTASSNLPAVGDARALYLSRVQPLQVELSTVAAHYALTSLFRSYPEVAQVYCYTLTQKDYSVRRAGRFKLGLGRVHITCERTQSSCEVVLAALHLGDHNLSGGVIPMPSEDQYAKLCRDLTTRFARADVPEVLRALDLHFGAHTFSLQQLFKDEQRELLRIILSTTLSEVESLYRQLYENHAPLMRFLADLEVPQPPALMAAAQLALNNSLRLALQESPPDFALVTRLLDEAERAKVAIDKTTLSFALTGTIERLCESLRQKPEELSTLRQLDAAIKLASAPTWNVNLWKAQNTVYELLQIAHPRFAARAAKKSLATTAPTTNVGQSTTPALLVSPVDSIADDTPAAKLWLRLFAQLGRHLKIRMPVQGD